MRRFGAGVVAYVPRYGAYVTLSRAPRETALFPVHCCHSSLPGRYASAAYTPVCGGTTGNMPRIPGGVVPGMLRYVAGRPRRSSSVRCFGMVRTGSLRGDPPAVSHCRAMSRRYAPVRGGPPYWRAMARYDTPGVRRFTSPSPVGGVTRPDMARILPGVPVGAREKPTSTDRLWSPISPRLEGPHLRHGEKALSGAWWGGVACSLSLGAERSGA